MIKIIFKQFKKNLFIEKKNKNGRNKEIKSLL